MFLGATIIIYMNCSDKQLNTVKKHSSVKMFQFEKVVSFHPKTVVSHLKNTIGRGIADAVYSDHALDLGVTCMFFCRASCTL